MSYQEILDDFGWSESDDRAAAQELHSLLGPRDGFRNVGTELKHRARAIVVGCAQSLDTMTAESLPAGVVVAADGATARLRQLGIVPRVVVTDLDGDPEALQWAADAGASIVVHAHGHNRDRLAWGAKLGPFVAATYQSTADDELAPMRNLGGLTDGDRAVLLCEAFQVKEIVLAAFDLNAPSSAFTYRSDPETKAKKLRWAAKIIDAVATRTRVTRLP